MKVIDNGTVTNPKGYKGTGLHIGIKKKNKDFALIVSDVEAKAVGTFTTNMVKAAPVLWDKHIVENYETVKAIAINSGKINDAMVSDCDALSESLGIPVVAVDNELNNSAEAFRFMGELLGVEDHAEELAQYAEQVFTDINALSDIPEEKKVSVYFGNGEDSLETAPRGSQHAQILDAINAVNVADLELGDGSRVQISAEQLLAWDPDVIVVNGEPKADKSGSSAAEDILSNPDYASLKAVQDQKVYGTPNAPFSWVDRPAGPNRLIGMRWFSALIYPEYIKCDINEEIHKFFDLFYHVDLSDEQLENVLKGTL